MNERTNTVAQNFFPRRRLPAILFCLLLAAISVCAATLPEYRKNIQIAAELTDDLKTHIQTTENLAQLGTEYENYLVAQIRRAVPTSEKIEWQSAVVETGNQWLEAELNLYAESKDLQQRAEILTGIGERLAAIEEKLAELENPGVSSQSKDEDKRKLAEILRREEYQKPEEKQESAVQKWWRELLDWFADAFPKPNISEETEKGARSVSFVLQILLYALVLGVIGFLIYRFAPVFLRKRGSRENSVRKDRVILGDRIAADQSAENLFGEAEALARNGDLSAAIRKGYIALLCDLSDRRIIGLAQHKTNRDYLRDLRADRALYDDVSNLTGSFERHWYGSQNAREEDWNEFRERYKKTVPTNS